MKETGLMFKAPLVRAILAGQKTQTRRILKLHPGFDFEEREDRRLWPWAEHPDRLDDVWQPAPCGDIGDRIYVRETWCQQGDDDGFLVDGAYWYRATTPDVMDSEDMEKSPWRPSIHMPKAAARIWLEVTGVRVERLQSISEADCWREGIEEVMHDFDDASQCEMAKRLDCCIDDAKPLFAQLWESTGGDWAANPWVWVIDFKTISTTGRPA